MSSVNILLLLGSPNHMQNVSGRHSLSFVCRDTQDLCLNSEPRVESLDFSKARGYGNSMDMGCNKKLCKPARVKSAAPGGVETRALISDTGFAFFK